MEKNYTFFTTVEKEYEKDPCLNRDDVIALQEWASKQAHLPAIPELKMLRFLHSNYYKIEATKQCIEHYYTIRANCDEIFNHHDVFSQPIINASKMMLCNLVASKPEHKVIMMSVYDTNPDLQKSCGPIYAFIDIINQLCYAQHGASDDHIVIIDGSNVKFSQVLKLSLIPSKVLMFYVQNAVPIRLKATHVVNVSPGIDKLYTFFKPFLKGELIDKVYLHSNIEDLYKYLPKDSLPKDLGGYGPSYAELYADQRKILEANAKWIEALGDERADESKRQKKINFGDMFGYEGSFKTLQID